MEVEANSSDLIIFSEITHVQLLKEYIQGLLKVYLLKTKVGKSIQECICFQLKIGLLNIKFVAHLLFRLNWNLILEKCDDFVSF